jgi:hypothetical protein
LSDFGDDFDDDNVPEWKKREMLDLKKNNNTSFD